MMEEVILLELLAFRVFVAEIIVSMGVKVEIFKVENFEEAVVVEFLVLVATEVFKVSKFVVAFESVLFA